MDGLDSTSLNSSNSTVNLGSDLGPLGDDASPSAQASWDQAAADAGLGVDDGTNDMGWGGTGGGVPTLTVRPSATGDDANASGNAATDAGGHTDAAPATADADKGKSFWQSVGDFLTDPHTALGAASFAPSVFGSAASAADGLLYAAQGKYTDAGLSLGAAAVGMVSDAGAARLAAKGIKAGAEALAAGHAGETVAHVVEAERAVQAEGTVAHTVEGVTDAEKAAQQADTKAGDAVAPGRPVEGSVPNADKAEIDPRKAQDYALNPDHPVGGNKARVFESALGFNKSNASDLLRQLQEGVTKVSAQPGKVDGFGTRFTADIPVVGPKGSGVVRTGWIISPGSDIPKLTTMFVK